MHAFYADAPTQDIWHDSNTNGAGWGTDTEVVDDTTIQWLSGLNAYTNKYGQRVLGYIYDFGPHADDGGNIRYGEFVLSGGGAAPVVTLNGLVNDDGLPSNSTTSQWTVVSGPGTVVFSNASSPVTTATFDQLGTYVLRLTGSDTELSSSDDVTVTVSEPSNTPPAVNAGADQTITLPSSANLNGSAIDDGLPVGSTIASQWTQVSGPGSTTFGDAAAPVTTASFDLPGTYVLRLSGDDSLLSASDDVTVTVLPEGTQQTFIKNFTLASGSDDAEESASGAMDLTSSDLELGNRKYCPDCRTTLCRCDGT